MKPSSLRRIGAYMALAVLSAAAAQRAAAAVSCSPAYTDCAQGFRLVPGSCQCVPEYSQAKYCPALACEPGQRMNFQTCRCAGAPSEDYRPYEKLGADLRDAVGSGDSVTLGVAAITASVAEGKLDDAAQGLEGLFSGAATPAASAFAVSASAKENPNPPTIFYPDAKPATPAAGKRKEIGHDVPRPPILLVDCGDSNGCRSETGKIVEDATGWIFKGIEKRIEEHDYTKDSRETYGGCRMKGTCSK